MALALIADHFRNGSKASVLTLRRSLPVFPDKQTFSPATPIGCSFPRPVR